MSFLGRRSLRPRPCPLPLRSLLRRAAGFGPPVCAGRRSGQLCLLPPPAPSPPKPPSPLASPPVGGRLPGRAASCRHWPWGERGPLGGVPPLRLLRRPIPGPPAARSFALVGEFVASGGVRWRAWPRARLQSSASLASRCQQSARPGDTRSSAASPGLTRLFASPDSAALRLRSRTLGQGVGLLCRRLSIVDPKYQIQRISDHFRPRHVPKIAVFVQFSQHLRRHGGRYNRVFGYVQYAVSRALTSPLNYYSLHPRTLAPLSEACRAPHRAAGLMGGIGVPPCPRAIVARL